MQVLEALMAWCDAQLAGYTSAVQNDLEEMQEQTTPWIRVQVRPSALVHHSMLAPAARRGTSACLPALPPAQGVMYGVGIGRDRSRRLEHCVSLSSPQQTRISDCVNTATLVSVTLAYS